MKILARRRDSTSASWPVELGELALLSAAVAPLAIERCEQVLRDVDTESGPRRAIDVVLVGRA